MTIHSRRKAHSWISELMTLPRAEVAKPQPDRTAPTPTPSHTRGTRRKSRTDLDLRGGDVLEAEALAPAPLLARLLEQHLAVPLLVAPPAEVDAPPRRRVAREEHRRLPHLPAPMHHHRKKSAENPDKFVGKKRKPGPVGLYQNRVLCAIWETLGFGERGDIGMERARGRACAAMRRCCCSTARPRR